MKYAITIQTRPPLIAGPMKAAAYVVRGPVWTKWMNGTLGRNREEAFAEIHDAILCAHSKHQFTFVHEQR